MRLLLARATSLHGQESGQVTTFFVSLLLLFFMFMALSLDVGVWLLDRRITQNQADTAVTAGVLELPAADTALATDAAFDWLEKNGAPRESVCTPDNTPDEYNDFDNGVAYIRDDTNMAYTIRVCLSHQSLLLLSNLLEITGVQIRAVAAAGLQIEPVPYALMAMRPGGCNNLFFSGSRTTVNLQGSGNSYTESDDDCAFHVDGRNARVVTEGEHHVRGGADGCGPPGNLDECVHDPDGNLNVVEGYPNIDDPWGCPPQSPGGACVDVPPMASGASCPDGSRSFTSSGTLAAGTYCSLVIAGNGTEVRLTGGVYVFKNGVSLDGGTGTRLYSDGQEVLIYMTCNPSPCSGGAIPAPFNIRGDDGSLPKLELKGHSDYSNIALWVDRAAGSAFDCSSAAGAISITGQGDVEIDGNIYATSTTVDLGGQGDAEFDINGSIVGDRICFRGQATYNVEWDTSASAKFGPPELVE
jgi:hypothetical protein